MMTWALVAIALIGTVMNVQMARAGFLFWIISNGGLAVVNYRRGEKAQATLFSVYLALAIWGWLAWGK
jgi:hypothetical protein